MSFHANVQNETKRKVFFWKSFAEHSKPVVQINVIKYAFFRFFLKTHVLQKRLLKVQLPQ